MKTHVQIVAILHLVFSILGLLTGLGLALMMVIGGAVSGDETARLVTSGVAVFFVGLFAVLSIPGIIGAIGTLKYRNWGRIVLIIVGIFNLPGIPIGTALGIYTLWTLLNSESAALFEGKEPPVTTA